MNQLTTTYDGRKSFYGKAIAGELPLLGEGIWLKSYDTFVARIIDGKAQVFGLYSATTTRHIKEFLRQNGFKAETSKQIMADYETTRQEAGLYE